MLYLKVLKNQGIHFREISNSRMQRAGRVPPHPPPYRGEPILSYSRACPSLSCRRMGRGERHEKIDSSLMDWGSCGFETGGEPCRFEGRLRAAVW